MDSDREKESTLTPTAQEAIGDAARANVNALSFRSLDKKKPWTLRHCFGKRLATLARSDRVLGQRRGWLIML
jgi:hypothetical protein